MSHEDFSPDTEGPLGTVDPEADTRVLRAKARMAEATEEDRARAMAKAATELARAEARGWPRAELDGLRARLDDPDKALMSLLLDREIKNAQSRRRNRRREENGPVESFTRQEIYDRDSGTCGACRQPVDPDSAWQVDHVVPLAAGGTHTRANVRLTHGTCNNGRNTPADALQQAMQAAARTWRRQAAQ